MRLMRLITKRRSALVSMCALARSAQSVSSSETVILAGCPIVRMLVFLILVPFAQPAFAFIDSLRNILGGAPYPVIHSKYAAEGQSAMYRLSWLDNDRLLFVGQPIAEILARFEKKATAKRRNLRFYIWNTRTNDVQTYKEVGEWGRFCYNDLENWIRYSVPGKRNAVMEGKFGEEHEVQIDPAEHTPEGRAKREVFFHELTCREHPYSPINMGTDRWVFPLYLDHGILDVRGKRADDLRPIKLFSNDYKQAIELPLSRRAVDPRRIYFSKYKNAYVLYGSTAPPTFSNTVGTWPRGVNQPVYLLSPRGKLMPGVEIPWHERYREALGVYFTVRGLVYAGGREPDNKGFFLVEDGKVVRLLKAVGPRSIDAGGVSPDGCKVAAAISLDSANKSGGVKVIDLCRGGGR